MKLPGTASDTHAVDARTRDSARSATDNASNDNAPPFDGVLAGVQTEAKTSQGAPASTGKTGNVAAPTDGTTKPATDPASENTIIDAFIGILGQGAITPKAGHEDVEKKDDDQTDSSSGKKSGTDAVDSLLERVVSDGGPVANAATAPTTPSTDLMSILLLGAASNKVPQSAPATPSGGNAALLPAAAPNTSSQSAPAIPSGGNAALKTAAAAGTLDGSREDPPTEPQTTTDDNEVIISNISITRHLAPAAQKQNAALPSQDPKDAASKASPLAGTTVSTGAETARPSPEEAIVSVASPTPRHNTASSADAVTSALQSTTYAAVRSVATAIGDLAAKTAPTVASAEPSKATLGAARTMTLQMTPAELGTVDIRMHITGNTLDVQLTISKAETLGMVNRERDTLATALGDQNYQLNSLVIQDGGAAASSGGQNATTHGDTSGDNAHADRQGGGTGPDTRGDGQPGHGSERSARDDRQRNDGNPSSRAATAVPGGGSLYV